MQTQIRLLLQEQFNQGLHIVCYTVQVLEHYIYGSTNNSGLHIREHIGKLFSLLLIQNICCGYSKEPSQWDSSFEHPKHMFKFMGKKII